MSAEKIMGILEAHGVECDIDEEGTVWALDVMVSHGRDHSEWVDVTGWNIGTLRNWLGY